MKNLANVLTLMRLAASPVLLMLRPLSFPFYAAYVFCGLTDMADGWVARKTRFESRAGALLDSTADTIFVLACCVTLLPRIELPAFLWVWAGGIALVRAANVVVGRVHWHTVVLLHTFANKLTGFLLFLWPLLMGVLRGPWYACFLCAAATFASAQEGWRILTGRFDR